MLNVWIEFQSDFACFFFILIAWYLVQVICCLSRILSDQLVWWKWPRINYQVTSANKFHLNKRQSISKVNKINQIQNEWNSFFPECEWNDVRYRTKILPTRLKFTKSLINRKIQTMKKNLATEFNPVLPSINCDYTRKMHNVMKSSQNL